MNTRASQAGPGGEGAEPLAAASAAAGPAAIVRELARDLMQQRRLLREDAARVEGALRDHDWPAVRAIIERALARHPQILPPHQAAPAESRATAPAGQQEILAGLLRLVLRLCDALPKLAVSDSGIDAKLESIRAALAQGLTAESIQGLDARITELIDQQVQLHQNLQEARSSLKDMLTLVVGRLGVVGTSTSRFQERVDGYRGELDGQTDAAAVRRIVGSLLADTQIVSEEIRQSQQELSEARRKVDDHHG